MTSPRGTRSAHGRGRRASTGALVAIAVAIACTLMATLTARAIVARDTCRQGVRLTVAVTADLAPAVQRIASVFNRQHHQSAGHCSRVSVTAASPAAVAAQLDGQHVSPGQASVGAWIPDSSLWVDVARSFPAGARAVQPTATHVARSPLMIVMPGQVAARVPEFAAPVGWSFLLPAALGGPPAALGLKVELPDPAHSAVGLATMIQVTRLLGVGGNTRADLAKFVFSSQPSAQFDNPAALASFATLAAPPVNEHPVTIASEQAVLRFDRAHPAAALGARYPMGPGPLLGSPELDYPYVLTTSDPAEIQVGRQFEQALKQRYAAAVVRYDGFRSADGARDAAPGQYGLNSQLIETAAAAAPGQAQAITEVWDKLALGSRDLALIDTSAAMGSSDGLPGQTLEYALTQTARIGLGLFPDSTQMGLWQFPGNPPSPTGYRPLVPVGPLPAELGLISRRQQLEQITATLRPSTGGAAALNSTILAAYKSLLASYQPGYANTVLILTAGIDNAGDISLGTLLTRLRALYDPNRRVEIVAIMFGGAGNFPALQQITSLTGGAAYQITDPAQVARIFFEALAHRICSPGCAPP